MATNLLSDRKCTSTKLSDGETLLADGENLYLRIRQGGKDWLLIPRLGKKRIKIGLGSYPAVSLAEARQTAADMRKQVREGIDPRQEKKATENTAVAKTPETVFDLFHVWHRLEASKRKDEGAWVLRSFNKDVLPRIGAMRLLDVKRGAVTMLLDAVAERGVTRTCGILLADMRQMFEFAVIREIMPSNPTNGLKKTSWNGVSPERDRVLSDEEIRLLAKKLPATLNEASECACWIMLSTCCRIGEISMALWERIDLEKAVWVIPKEDSKTNKEHTVDLSPFSLNQFKRLKALSGKSRFVMPARSQLSTQGHCCTKTVAKQICDRQLDPADTPMRNRTKDGTALVLPGGRWTPHDLRRTGSTLMGGLMIRPDVVEKCLNHVEQNKMKRIYQRYELRPEMKAAWLRLGEHIEQIIAS